MARKRCAARSLSFLASRCRRYDGTVPVLDGAAGADVAPELAVSSCWIASLACCRLATRRRDIAANVAGSAVAGLLANDYLDERYVTSVGVDLLVSMMAPQIVLALHLPTDRQQ